MEIYNVSCLGKGPMLVWLCKMAYTQMTLVWIFSKILITQLLSWIRAISISLKGRVLLPIRSHRIDCAVWTLEVALGVDFQLEGLTVLHFYLLQARMGRINWIPTSMERSNSSKERGSLSLFVLRLFSFLIWHYSPISHPIPQEKLKILSYLFQITTYPNVLTPHTM